MSLGSVSNGGSSIREDRHPTGVTILDEEELRGIPKGSTIAVIGDPDSATELLLHSLAATGRQTEYITTLRSELGLMDDIKRARVEDNVDEEEIEENVVIRDVVSSADSYDDTIRRSLSIVEDGNLIIDTFSKYHDDPKTQLDLARRIHQKTKRNGGLTYLYFVASDTDQLNRHEKEICQMVDGVFNVRTDIVGGDKAENNLFINKLRGMELPDSAQNLVFGERLSIDVTADIG